MTGKLPNPKGCSTPQAASERQSANLERTVGVFQARIQRKLREQEAKTQASHRASDDRQTLMLKAMNMARRSLNDLSKVELGPRFQFRLNVSDWEGWPRIELSLYDLEARAMTDHGLIISAHDRNSRGTIFWSLRDGEVLERLFMADSGEFERLPLILKKSLRSFLDGLTGYLVTPPKVEENDPLPLREAKAARTDSLAKKLGEVDCFIDADFESNQNQVTDEERAEHRPLDLVNE